VRKIAEAFMTAVEWWTAFLLAAMVLVVALGVLFRYAFGAALVWYDEFASYLLVWLTFYGAVVASYRRRHIGLEVLVERLPAGWKRAVELCAEACVFGFQIVLCYFGWVLTQKIGDETAISLVWVQMRWVYSVLPISGGLMLLVSGAELLRLSLGKAPFGHAASPQQDQEGGAIAWSGSSSE
jgi:TRAP-type C4-dicarboxylate transport system permease small subunit